MALRNLSPRLAAADLSKAKLPPKTVDAHYTSPEHRAWRAEVLRRAGYKCQDVGPHNGSLHADHIIERKDGGDPLDPSNGLCRCAACHNRKTAKVRTERLMAHTRPM